MTKVVHKSIKFRENWLNFHYVMCRPNVDLPDDGYDWSSNWEDVTCRRCLKKRPESQSERGYFD